MIGFADYLEAVHAGKRAPYPWQQRLADRCAGGEPPAVIAVPTGTGKTTTIDALLWALAHQADLPAAGRTVGVRIVWAIDRRILVDEVHDHALTLAAKLAEAQDSTSHPLHEMAQRLARLAGGGPPLVATRWRGGIHDPTERREAFQPEIITSTVAQIGSRLLFRGYGIGERSLAMAAGLAAVDSTICLDEAHLAEPFRQTVDVIKRTRSDEETLPLPPLRLITITATPTAEAGEVIHLTEDDRDVLAPRLEAPKEATLVEPASDRDRESLLADSVVEHLSCGAPTVACVVNTVHRARRVFEKLQARLKKDEETDLALLIGPQRPADRSLIFEQHRAVLLNGQAPSKPLVLVATQTFEVGLDADVASMVTESASATALIQRLGRLNRRGLPGRRGQATIVRDPDRWLYAADEPLAWEWLCGLEGPDGKIDVSVAALDQERSRPAPQSSAWAPALTSQIVDLLVQTAPRPAPWAEPDIEVFMRGVDADPAADVSVCWRSDLRERRTDATEYRDMLLTLVPPQRQELLSLSLTGARALISARYPGASSASAASKIALADADVEGETPGQQAPDPGNENQGVPFWVLRRNEVVEGTLGDNDEGRLADSRSLRPGDVLILPTAAGGADEHGLAPRSPEATDVAQDLRPDRSPPRVRITPEALAAADGPDLPPTDWAKIATWCRHAERQVSSAQNAASRREIVANLVQRLSGQLPDHPGLQLLGPGTLEDDGYTLALRGIGAVDGGDEVDLDDDLEDGPPGSLSDALDPGAEGWVDPEASQSDERAWVLLPIPRGSRDQLERPSEDPMPPPTIDEHAWAVHDHLESSLECIDLPSQVREALLVAAKAHDHGKADPRVQAFYRRGRHVIGATPIAKSEFGTRDPKMSRIARWIARLPRDLRHEVSSVAVLAGALSKESERDQQDTDLALHLVGTHHGLGRAIPSVPAGGAPARVFQVQAAGIEGSARGDTSDGWDDGAWLERFWRVIARYGPWGTAYLEALLMLADRGVSSKGS